MTQTPPPGAFLLKWRGDTLDVVLDAGAGRRGRAALRTDIGNAHVRRIETIAETERGETPMERAWTDIPLEETSPGVFKASVPLDETGVFSAKACFFPEGSSVPEWPEGGNIRVKVESALAVKSNSIYTVFPRQFGSFREIVRRLPLIMDTMGFRIIQTLPPFPVPTTYAVMGEYGCPFAALDFFSVDPAMAEFDESTTPLDQFLELVDAVHARNGLFFVDLPANHTGWASVLQTHHPDWFKHGSDGRFACPGAWGVKWADLVELDYSNPKLRSYMAEVFLFWCRNGVDGFRCDAGYMIPEETWRYIVARVREEHPDTVFMLEGLGGDLRLTDALLASAGLDWAYSELFQTYGRGAFEWYLPGAAERSEKFGALVHFAETHDNDRLAKGGQTYARLRVQLAALLSWQGAWGIANGVEWFATEKIDVHGKNDLNWGAKENMVRLVSKLNQILSSHPSFRGPAHLEVVTRGAGDTLAVSRGPGALVIANLDCSRHADIEWDLRKFPAGEAYDMVSDRRIDVTGPVRLEPGETMFLVKRAPAKRQAAPAAPAQEPAPPVFRWRYPADLKRDFAIPPGECFEASAPCAFSLRVVEPATGATLASVRSSFVRGGHRAILCAPPYEGDGTACRRLAISIVAYCDGRGTRNTSRLFVTPPASAARAMRTIPGAKVREDPARRTILSNGAGAASQMRLGWGTIASQYDAILAANPDATCPSDRLNIWTRTRCWLQREGFVREFDARCVDSFEADPAGRFARWNFTVPCGMGKSASFVFEVALAEGRNAARLKAMRVAGGADDVEGPVRLVFRPDIEWRSFHETTKAWRGAEGRFPAAVEPAPRGFSFHPAEGAFVLSVEGGDCHHEPQWTYNVPHPEEGARGQDPSGDLFSPVWISADLATGGETTLSGEAFLPGAERRAGEPLSFPERGGKSAKALDTIGSVMRDALDLFIVRRDGLKTVIAGYPWFLDWGRDTFIFMRGMIAAGRLDDSIAILKAFAAFEQDGTLPNIIYGKTAGNRDTVDAQLWFIRCTGEVAAAGGDVSGLEKTCEAIVENYLKGTPNGIKVDEASGLVRAPSHFTWMDTNYPACTPRNGYPVEIQALWISALKQLGRLELACRAEESLIRYFKKEQGGYCDCLDAPHGESAADARRDESVRPNQLFLATLGVLPDRSILESTSELLVPGGIRTLGAESPQYRGVYAGDEDSLRKPAYHNGTVWAWPFPLFAEAMAAIDPSGKEAALSLLAGAVENINEGCACHLSECADGDSPHAQRACTAQAWSASELLRVWLKLGGN